MKRSDAFRIARPVILAWLLVGLIVFVWATDGDHDHVQLVQALGYALGAIAVALVIPLLRWLLRPALRRLRHPTSGRLLITVRRVAWVALLTASILLAANLAFERLIPRDFRPAFEVLFPRLFWPLYGHLRPTFPMPHLISVWACACIGIAAAVCLYLFDEQDNGPI